MSVSDSKQLRPDGSARESARQGNVSGEDLRQATFPQALRGYDRQAVHSLLDRVADWVESGAAAVPGQAPRMREELAKVGERTAGILTAAEEAAQNLRDEAVEYAERLRADVEEEARKSRLNASQRMDEIIRDSEQKAERIIDDAIARRRKLNQAITSLVERRDEIAHEVSKLAEDLLDAVEQPDPAAAEPEGVEPDTGGDGAELEETQLDADEAETQVHRA